MERLRWRGPGPARRPRHAARRRPQDRQRRARQRLRRPGHHRRHALRPAGPPVRLDRRDRPGQGRARGRRAVPATRLDDAQPPPDLARPSPLPRPQPRLRRLPVGPALPGVRRGTRPTRRRRPSWSAPRAAREQSRRPAGLVALASLALLAVPALSACADDAAIRTAPTPTTRRCGGRRRHDRSCAPRRPRRASPTARRWTRTPRPSTAGCPTITLPCLGGGRDVDLAGLTGEPDRAQLLGADVRALPAGGTAVPAGCTRPGDVRGARRRLLRPDARQGARVRRRARADLSADRRPGGRHAGADAGPGPADDGLRRRGRRRSTHVEYGAVQSADDLADTGRGPISASTWTWADTRVTSAPDDRAVPAWLAPVVDAASTVRAAPALAVPAAGGIRPARGLGAHAVRRQLRGARRAADRARPRHALARRARSPSPVALRTPTTPMRSPRRCARPRRRPGSTRRAST